LEIGLPELLVLLFELRDLRQELLAGRAREPGVGHGPLDLVFVVVNRLAGAAGLTGAGGHIAVRTDQSTGRVVDPSRKR